jgi:glycosyltransferase involved in cell wall biosynthesis
LLPVNPEKVSEKKRIRVLQCIRQGQIGGGESHLLSLTENLDKSEFDPVVLSFTDGPMIRQLETMNINTAVIHTEKPFDFMKWGAITRWVKNQNVDLIHAHGTRANSNIFWAAKKLKVPLVYTIHGWSFHDDQTRLVKQIRTWGERFLTSRSSVNISVSQSNKETGIRHFSNFLSEVVYNGIDTNKFNPHNNFPSLREELNIPDESVLVLFLGRFTHQKQPLALMKAFEKAAATNPHTYLLMVGDGELKKEAEMKYQTSAFKNRMQLLPFRADVPAVLYAADIFVLPSLWEGMPIALLEAMAMGKAIIATQTDGVREIIRNNVNGLLIATDNIENDLETALDTLCSNGELRKKLAAGAMETVRDNFCAASMTRQIESIYRRLLN